MTKFKVKKNKKYFWGPRWNFIGRNKKEFNVKAYFNRDCEYKLTENYNQINKLTGQSFKLFPWYDKVEKKLKPGHHKDSVRFGWRCVDGEEIEIMAYAYLDGTRKDKKILNTNTEEWVHLNFRETDKYYIFKAIKEGGESSMVKFKKRGTKKGFLGMFIYKLYPYFGGRIPAPYNMTIELKYFKKFI